MPCATVLALRSAGVMCVGGVIVSSRWLQSPVFSPTVPVCRSAGVT